jgi:hypothetical protein
MSIAPGCRADQIGELAKAASSAEQRGEISALFNKQRCSTSREAELQEALKHDLPITCCGAGI